MKTNQRLYTFEDSDARIRSILDASDQGYEELDYIPSANRLTYTNGFYVNCCAALFIDIRDSSKLTNNHTRPVLAKIYRAYLSECVSILNQDKNCKEVYIHGDCVVGIFEIHTGESMNEAVLRAFELNALINLLNWRLENKGYVPIKCGIGIDYGRALMLQGGASNTGINEVIWMGDVVNRASKLCHQGNKDGQLPIQVSTAVFNKLTSQNYKNLLYPVKIGGLLEIIKQYQADAVSTEMNKKLEAEKRMSLQRRKLSGLLQLGSRYQPPATTVLSQGMLSTKPRLGLGASTLGQLLVGDHLKR